MRRGHSSSAAIWPAALQGKCVKQTGVKHGRVALYDMQEAMDSAGVFIMQRAGGYSSEELGLLLFTSGRFVNRGLETGARKRVRSDRRC